MMHETALEALLNRAEAVLSRLESWLPDSPDAPDWALYQAFQWRKRQGRGYFHAIAQPHRLRLDDLQGVARQKALLERNTRQFLRGLPANNALLWGSRGTGKSSLIKALLSEYAAQGLRVIEVDKQDLLDLVDIVEAFRDAPYRFILFCDDLSFEQGDPAYKALKSALDGSLGAPPENALIYATSNRRHLLPEWQTENQQTRVLEGEIHPGEAVEEKISLSERFGLWLSFYPFKQDEYLAIVAYWLNQLGHREVDAEAMRRAALQWALQHGSRSGRVAWQFARDWAGRHAL